MYQGTCDTCARCLHWELPLGNTQFGYCEVHDDATYKYHHCPHFTPEHGQPFCASATVHVIRG